MLTAEMGSWAYVKLTRPANLHLYPLEQAWLHGFVAGSEEQAFYQQAANHEQKFCRNEFCVDIKTNGAGFRADHSITTPLDIGVVGDSFAFGWGVQAEHRYIDRLSSRLPNLQMAQLAYPNGHSPPFYELFLQQNPQYWPRLLVVQLFAWNDLNHDQRDTVYLYDESGNWVGLGSKNLKVLPEGYIESKSQPMIPKYQGLRGLVSRSWFGRLASSSIKHQPPASPQKPASLADLDQGSLDDVALRALSHIENLATMANERGSDLVVLYIPFANLAGDYPMLCQYEPSLCGQQRIELDPLTHSIANWAQARSIAFLDPLADLRDAEKNGIRTYFETDGHWTPEGHEVIELSLLSWLCENAKIAKALGVGAEPCSID